MTERHSNLALHLGLGFLIAGGLVSTLLGALPGIGLLVAGLILAAVQRSTLARALRAPHPPVRRRRLAIAAVLGCVAVGSYGGFVVTVGDTWSITDTCLALIGTPAAFGAIGFLFAGIMAPRSPEDLPGMA